MTASSPVRRSSPSARRRSGGEFASSPIDGEHTARTHQQSPAVQCAADPPAITTRCTCPCHRGAGHHDGNPCPTCNVVDPNAYKPTYCTRCGFQTGQRRQRCRKCLAEYPYVWRWRRVQVLDTGQYRLHPFADRVGTHCRVIARGAMNSAAIEFEADGHRAIVSRNALKKASA